MPEAGRPGREREHTGPVLASPFVAPPTLVAPALARPRLDEWLTEGMRGSVVLVLGEPASGKTTLLLQWLASGAVDDHSVAWLTVPPGISDEVLFWRYLLRALELLGLPVDDLRAALLDREPPGDGWLTTLANRLAECPKPPLIVIDDLHELGSDAALESLADVLELRPAGVTFVFGTQVSPPWPLTGWRMSGRFTEIGSDQLRMTADEVRELVRSVGGASCSTSSTRRGWSRWPPGCANRCCRCSDAPACSTASPRRDLPRDRRRRPPLPGAQRVRERTP